MGSDSAVAASAPPSAFVRDAGKKKRTNRSAKLKQCKLDARREQWLSQVKNKGDKEPANGCLAPPSSMPLPISGGGQGGNERLSHSCPTPRPPPAGDNEVVVSQDSDSESLTPIRTNCCPEKELHTSSGSSSSGSYSGDATEEDEEEEDSLDDWEAIADALNSESQAELESSSSPGPVAAPECASLPPRVRARPETTPKPAANPRAWRPDDEFRPQSLPNLAKQRSFPSNLDRRYSHAAGKWTNIGIISTPSSCPICYEDLDLTDSSFLPCSCGFRLCLFCHKRILEEADGRCPGCRSPYSTVQEEVAVNIAPSHCRLLRSCSMSMRY